VWHLDPTIKPAAVKVEECVFIEGLWLEYSVSACSTTTNSRIFTIAILILIYLYTARYFYNTTMLTQASSLLYHTLVPVCTCSIFSFSYTFLPTVPRTQSNEHQTTVTTFFS
jgi:hypothetical protein